MGHDHKRRNGTREITEYYCEEPGCRFEGEPAVQGVCWNSEGEIADWDKLADAGERMSAEFKAIRIKSNWSPEETIRWLEAMYETAMINWTMALDEVIRLRAEIALLKEGR